MLKLKLQYFGHLLRRVDSLEKTLMLGGIGGRRRRARQRMRWLDGLTDSMDWVWVNSGSWWWTGRPGVLRFVGSQRVGHDWATDLNWWYFSLVFNEPLFCSPSWISYFYSHQQGGGFFFLCILSNIYCCRFFCADHSDLCEAIPHCSSHSQFSNTYRCWASFQVLYGHLYVFFRQTSV